MGRPETARYVIGVGFAVMVFAAGFYALVPYPFELDDLVKGAMISLMTLSAQFVFGEALAHSVGQVVIVVRADVTPQQAVLDAISYIGEGKSISLVLNQCTQTSHAYYYGYGEATSA